jgi:hypothetical protein
VGRNLFIRRTSSTHLISARGLSNPANRARPPRSGQQIDRVTEGSICEREMPDAETNRRREAVAGLRSRDALQPEKRLLCWHSVISSMAVS